jgi:voltage-gated potassium channel
MNKKTIKNIVEESGQRGSVIFNGIIQFIILVSIVSFSIETVPGLEAEFRRLLRIIEIVTVLMFTAEYLLRLYVSDAKLKYIFSFFGLVDLVAILPFYIGMGIDLRAIRIVRVLRVFRAFKFLRYGKAIRRIQRALAIAREELAIFLILTVVLLFISSVGIYYFENEAQPELYKSIFHSMWWAVVTLTTVGYGDVYPITAGGRIFTGFVLLTGVGVISFPAGVLASALSKARAEEDAGDKK